MEKEEDDNKLRDQLAIPQSCQKASVPTRETPISVQIYKPTRVNAEKLEEEEDHLMGDEDIEKSQGEGKCDSRKATTLASPSMVSLSRTIDSHSRFFNFIRQQNFQRSCLGKVRFAQLSLSSNLFNKSKCFDPGGQIAFWFPSTVSPFILFCSFPLQSPKSPAMVDFPATRSLCEPISEVCAYKFHKKQILVGIVATLLTNFTKHGHAYFTLKMFDEIPRSLVIVYTSVNTVCRVVKWKLVTLVSFKDLNSIESPIILLVAFKVLVTAENGFFATVALTLGSLVDGKHKRNQDHIDWKWQEVSSLSLFIQIASVIIFHREMTKSRKLIGLMSIIILPTIVAIDFGEHNLRVIAVILDQYTYHIQLQSMGKIIPITLISYVMDLPLNYCDLILAYNQNLQQGVQRGLLCLIVFYNQLESSKVLKGFMKKTDVTSFGKMKRRPINSHILIFDSYLDYERRDTQTNAGFLIVGWLLSLKMEEGYSNVICIQILKYKPDLVIKVESFSELGHHCLNMHGVSIIKRLIKTGLDGICEYCVVMINKPNKLQELWLDMLQSHLWCPKLPLELLHFGRHVHFGVNPLILMCFICNCTLDVYDGFEEAIATFCNPSACNDVTDGLVSMLVELELHIVVVDCFNHSLIEMNIIAIGSVGSQGVKYYFAHAKESFDEAVKGCDGVSHVENPSSTAIRGTLNLPSSWKGMIGIGIQLLGIVSWGEFEFDHLLMHGNNTDKVLQSQFGQLFGPRVVVEVGLYSTSYFLLLNGVQVAHSSSQCSKLVLNRFAFVAIFHRKMIYKGSVLAQRILLKWKTLPLKHGTYEYSSLRTRMFRRRGYCDSISIISVISRIHLVLNNYCSCPFVPSDELGFIFVFYEKFLDL